MFAQEKEIKKILTSVSGRRLLTCMLLMQPITSEELKRFPEFFFEIFDSRRFPLTNNNFANVSNVKTDYPRFRHSFGNEDISGEDRILRTALKSGLIVRVPAKKGGKKNYYYFLNSDIIFNIGADGLEITENKNVYPKLFPHHVFNLQDNEYVSLNEEIAFRQSDYIQKPNDEKYDYMSLSLRMLFLWFWWMIRYPSFVSAVLNAYDSALGNRKKGRIFFKPGDFPLKQPKQRYLFVKAKRDNVIRAMNNDEFTFVSPMFDRFFKYKFSLSFVPSYSILRCFSNFKYHVKQIINWKGMEIEKNSPMQLLKILTSEDYTIIPKERQTIFTSILMYKNLDLKQINKYRSTPVKLNSPLFKRFKLMETTSIARNTFFVEEVFGWQEGPVAPFFKSSLPDHFLLSDLWHTYNEGEESRRVLDSFLIYKKW